MERRTFVASAISLAAAALLPGRRSFGASASVQALGSTGKQILIGQNDIDDLRRSLRGQLLTPGQEGYDSARRIWNGSIDRRPALIARCAGAADVSQAVSFARTHDLQVAVRGGGHSFSGLSVCDGGLMIDLAPMRGVHVDPVATRARVEPGVLLGELDREAQFFGLATPAGTVSHTGAAGLTLGGGFGRLARRFGLACDNLRAADVIAANGRFVRASDQENSELLWGLRGGGGNFGVVTSFEYQLYEVQSNMYGGPLIFPFDQARAVLRSFASYIAGAPDELYTDAVITDIPQVGRVVLFDVCYSGPQSKAEAVLKPMREFGKPLQDGLAPATYLQLQSAYDMVQAPGRGNYEKSGFIRHIEPALIDTVVERIAGSTLDGILVAIVHHGGAISRVKPTATAFWNRQAGHTVITGASWNDPTDRAAADARMKWARETFQAIEPLTQGFYVNTLAEDDVQLRVRGTYGDNYPRLVKLKDKYDPANLFRRNANILPSRL